MLKITSYLRVCLQMLGVAMQPHYSSSPPGSCISKNKLPISIGRHSQRQSFIPFSEIKFLYDFLTSSPALYFRIITQN